VLDGAALGGAAPSAGAGAALDLVLVLLEETGWTRPAVLAAVAQAAPILGQCGVRLARVELLRVAVPPFYRDFQTPRSRILAQALGAGRPAVYFLAETRQHPAFDAEAIGRGNSRTRPELADSVWMTRATRDPGIALAHELYHVLANSGAHVELPGNLMRDATDPAHTRLDTAQCARLHESGLRHGLLRAP
jgi:hypothetical protein